MKRKGNQQNRKKAYVGNSTTQIDVLRRALDWVLKDNMFANLETHGNTKWMFRHLIALAVLAAWSDGRRMTDAFTLAKRLSQRLYGLVAIQTFQGLMRALVTHTPQLLPIVWRRLWQLMEQTGGEHFRIGKWLALAVDGSRFTTPRTLSNEQAFSAKNYGHGRKAKSRRKWKNKKRRSKKLGEAVKPQIWVTLLWHMGLKLPWCWKTGPSTASERHHFAELLASHQFPENTLFCGDAGFVGYELWKAILDAGHSFLIRVGGNVRLIEGLHARQGNGVVCLWPDAAARRKQPPLVLRLIEVKNERGTMYLVTNVLSQRALSLPQAARLYTLRWGIELQFRGVKQTFGRGKLRSRNSQHAFAELDWSLIALTMVQLLAVREQVKLDIPPESTSVAQALRAIRHAMEGWHEPATGGAKLIHQLQTATKDDYDRTHSKTSRYRGARSKDQPESKKPIILKATTIQKQTYREVKLAA
jgi:hypothetical protein